MGAFVGGAASGGLSGSAAGPIGAVLGAIIGGIFGLLGGLGGGPAIYAPSDIIKGKSFAADTTDGYHIEFNVPPNSLYAFYTVDQMNQLINALGWHVALAEIGAQFTDTEITNPALAPQTGDLVTNIVNGVTRAINNSNQSSVDSITSALTAEQDAINSHLDSITGGLTTFANNLEQSIGGTLDSLFGGIGDAIGSVVSAISGALTGAVKAIGSVLGDILSALKDKFDSLISAIKANGVSAIIPVIQLIIVEMQNIRNVITAIQTDIHSGMGALILLPVQLANSLGSIDATLNRALQQLGIGSMPKVTTDVQVGGVPFDTTFANNLESTFTPGGGPSVGGTTWQDLQSFMATCDYSSAQAALSTLHSQIENGPAWVKWLYWTALDIIGGLLQTGSVIMKQVKLAEEVANKLCPIERLDPASAVQAAIRKYITADTLTEELNAQGYDDAHIAVLTDLASQRITEGIVIDAWYRGIISDGDLSDSLHSFAYTDPQIAILKAQASYSPQLQDLMRWRNFGLIDDTVFLNGLTKLRMDDATRTNILNSYQQPETLEQQTALWGRLQASGNNYAPVSFSQQTPDVLVQAAAKENLTAGYARLAWLGHWQLPSYLTIIQSYFRNLRSPTDVQNAMAAENIPTEFWDELVKLQRPLIPARSIGTYVKAGVMSESDAVLELNSHGFDPQHIAWILQYATKTTSTANSTAAASIQNLSIATAKQLFLDGAISQAQYEQVLEAHKFPADIAALQAEADLTAEQAKERKQAITDLANEVVVGMIDVDTALAQLHQQGYTNAEIAKFQRSIRTSTRANAKSPTLADLKAFVKAQLITLDQFRAELQRQGWADPWLSAFVALETPSTTPTVT